MKLTRGAYLLTAPACQMRVPELARDEQEVLCEAIHHESDHAVVVPATVNKEQPQQKLKPAERVIGCICRLHALRA